MTIYFIADDSEASVTVEADHDGSVKSSIKGAYVKIGRTTQDANKRLGQLQTGNPRPLKFMGYIKTENEAEGRNINLAFNRRYWSNRANY